MAGTRPIGRRGLALGVAGAVLAPSVARSQDFPSKQAHVIVPYPPGGGTDIVARLIMSRLGERWKQTVIVDNKAGASGIVGSEIVAKSPPDGYTLLVTTSAHTINPFFTRHMPYDTERDFTPITVLVIGALALAGSTRAGFDSIQKFLAAARAEPGKYQFGSADSTTRMIGELFRVKSGLDIENVAYKGAAPMIQSWRAATFRSASPALCR
jgi:tripartite-type tricarboxylate transporter receptor subunit TctC